ncbi:MAG TPA: DUF4190 domain-containing protein, partial [Tepidisphaeraceae bacterium]
MSQMPPPMNAPVGYAQPSTGKPTNVLAIVSLICGILGCFILTPIVGLITGFLGLAKSKVLGGKGMAIAGIVLSILWIVGGIGAIGAGYWGVGKINEAVATATVQPTIDFLNNVREDPMGMEVGLNSSLMGPEAQALSEKLKPLGK